MTELVVVEDNVTYRLALAVAKVARRSIVRRSKTGDCFCILVPASDLEAFARAKAAIVQQRQGIAPSEKNIQCKDSARQMSGCDQPLITESAGERLATRRREIEVSERARSSLERRENQIAALLSALENISPAMLPDHLSLLPHSEMSLLMGHFSRDYSTLAAFAVRSEWRTRFPPVDPNVVHATADGQ